jgi:hypothetical protein
VSTVTTGANGRTRFTTTFDSARTVKIRLRHRKDAAYTAATSAKVAVAATKAPDHRH